MTYLSEANSIWELRPTKDDLLAGAKYAAITLPWTFDRMMINTGSTGQRSRALNIAKGIVCQEILHRALAQKGMKPLKQEKCHRDEDLFDFTLEVDGRLRKLDVKSFNYYSDYADVGRSPFSKNLVIDNSGYCGEDWRRFFPMLVPHTQILQPKESYCFVIATSIDPRRDIDTDRFDHRLTAFPFGESFPFLSSKRLCLAREEANKGVYVACAYMSHALMNASEIKIAIIGEWAGHLERHEIAVTRNTQVAGVGPFSCISALEISRDCWEQIHGSITIEVCQNDLHAPIFNTLRRNINVPPLAPLTITRDDFANLILPADYRLYVLGWIGKNDFLEKCRKYVGWVWPLDRVNRYHNQPWSQITANDVAMLTRIGFDDCVVRRPPLLKAGFLKTTGKGSGACCYVFPNIGYGGGVKETNLYVLPQDLHIMAELGSLELRNDNEQDNKR